MVLSGRLSASPPQTPAAPLHISRACSPFAFCRMGSAWKMAASLRTRSLFSETLTTSRDRFCELGALFTGIVEG